MAARSTSDDVLLSLDDNGGLYTARNDAQRGYGVGSDLPGVFWLSLDARKVEGCWHAEDQAVDTIVVHSAGFQQTEWVL